MGVEVKRWRAIIFWRALLVLAILGFVGGIIYVFRQFSSGAWTLFATPTPTPTFTSTPVVPTATLFVPTVTPSPTATATRAGPETYTVEEGDNLAFIAAEFEVDVRDLVAFNLGQGIDLTSGIVQPAQEIIIPPPEYIRPTATPIATGLKPGTLIEYTIQPGDFLGGLAEAYNTTVDAIIEANEDLENPDDLIIGQVIQIPYDIIILTLTATPSATATSTPDATAIAASTADICGTIWNDSNGNGAIDAGEAPITGSFVDLLDASGKVRATVAGNAEGRYCFTRVAMGEYTVVQRTPTGFMSTNAVPGVGGTRVNDVAIAVSVTSPATIYDFHDFLNTVIRR